MSPHWFASRGCLLTCVCPASALCTWGHSGSSGMIHWQVSTISVRLPLTHLWKNLLNVCLVTLGGYLLGVFQIFKTFFVFESRNKIVKQAENIWREESKEKEKWALNCRRDVINVKELVLTVCKEWYQINNEVSVLKRWQVYTVGVQDNEKCLGK